jgi:hypothetical protein
MNALDKNHPNRKMPESAKASATRPPNDVTLGEINDAIEYFYEQGFLEELTSDKRHYVEILLKLAAHYKGI